MLMIWMSADCQKGGGGVKFPKFVSADMWMPP